MDRGGAVLVPIPPLSSARRRAWNLGTPEREALTSRRSINQSIFLHLLVLQNCRLEGYKKNVKDGFVVAKGCCGGGGGGWDHAFALRLLPSIFDP